MFVMIYYCMKNISVRISDEQFKYLQQMAHHLSIERGINLRFSDLVREAISKTFPQKKYGQSAISVGSKISS